MINVVDQTGSEPTLTSPHLLASLDGVMHQAGLDMSRRAATIADGLRGSYGRILSLAGDDGARPSELAEGASISRQAVSQRVRELVARGWLTLEPDPADGRAVVARRTAEGNRILAGLETAIAELEAEWAAAVGDERYAVFRAVLDELASGRQAAIASGRQAAIASGRQAEVRIGARVER